LGITDYLFVSRNLLAQVVTLQHVIVVPLALVAIYFLKLKRKDFWKISVVQVVLLFIVARIFSAPEINVNCSFTNCLPFYLPPVLYEITWFAGMGFMIFIINFLLIRIKKLCSDKLIS
jgi:hypothetical protein